MYEVVIVGGGVAGLSLAWALAERGQSNVLVLEREDQHAVHATGRSAATLVEDDPVPTLAALKVGGGKFLRAPLPGFTETPLLRATGVLLLYRSPEPPALPPVETRLLTGAEVQALVPAIEPAAVGCGVLIPGGGHIDVHGLLSGYLTGARAKGVTVRRDAEVTGIDVEGGRVTALSLSDGERIETRVLVDAAGAWAEPIARLAGAAPISIEPRRRSIATFAAPEGVDPHDWPFTVALDDSIYFGPESGGLLLSPMEETPMAPCDARADDEAIAAAIERFAAVAPSLAPRTLRRRWAGLRSFAPDRILVVGEDPRVRGFFWLAGQGGCGIETSPFVSAIAADLLLDGKTDRFDAAILSPRRFAR